jgi:hypothetical protein
MSKSLKREMRVMTIVNNAMISMLVGILVFLGCTYHMTVNYGLHPVACLVAIILMLGGQGHLLNIALKNYVSR